MRLSSGRRTLRLLPPNEPGAPSVFFEKAEITHLPQRSVVARADVRMLRLSFNVNVPPNGAFRCV